MCATLKDPIALLHRVRLHIDLVAELPDRAAADKFWNEEPFAKNGGYQRDARITRWVFGD